MKKLLSILFTLPVFFSLHSFAGEPLTNIELKWKGTTNIKDYKLYELEGIQKHKIKIEINQDKRKNASNLVGENQEDKPYKQVTTTTKVLPFIEENLIKTLNMFSIQATDEKADYVLSGQVLDFFVTEVNTYKTNAAIKFTLKKGGKEIWSGIATGTNTRFGRSYSYDNYMESLSDSLIELCYQLLLKSDFTNKFN